MTPCSGYPVPNLLLNSAQEVIHTLDNPKPSGWNTQLWEDTFAGNSEFITVKNRFGNSIDRDGISKLSREVKNGGYASVKLLFLACMVWGFSGSSKANYGPWRTSQILADEDNGQRLKQAAIAVSGGNLRTAFITLQPLKWFRTPFSSKFLYFVGLGADVEPLPVILDSKVGQCLSDISTVEGPAWNTRDFGVIVRWNSKKNKQQVTINRKWDSYKLYVDCVNNWARQLGCPRADYVEYFMFRQGKSSSKSPIARCGLSI